MRRFITVAAVQMEIEPLAISANLKKAERMMSRIFAKNKADLVVFPEDCITGPIPYNLEHAQNENSDSIKTFQKLARKYKTYIVCGSFIKKVGEKYFNTSLLIDRRGKIILEYHKNKLWIPEKRYLAAGNEIPVVKTSIGKIGIIICWDLVYPETSRELARQGVDIICCPSYWTVEDGVRLQKKYGNGAEHRFVNALCQARAMENETLFIYSNGAGPARIHLKNKVWSGTQIGRTQICTPVWGTVKRMNHNKEGFIVYKYDRHLAKDAEYDYQLRADLRFFMSSGSA